MHIILNLSLLIFLFLILGLSADLAVNNIKYIARALKMRVFVLGAILGIATTLPELSVGINAAIRDVSGISVGNILGGITVIIGLILSISLILHKNISTEDSLKLLIPFSVVILFPFLVGSDAYFSVLDGIIMVCLYVFLILYLYKHSSRHQAPKESLIILEKSKINKALFLSLLGIVLVILSSNFIIDISSALLEKTSMSKLVLGILIFSIGTNLPEITIAFTSWRKKASELSISFLISSAFSNILTLGILSIIKPISFQIGAAYYVLAFFLPLIIVLFVIFSYSDKNLSRKEGFILLIIYLLFLATNIFLIGR